MASPPVGRDFGIAPAAHLHFPTAYAACFVDYSTAKWGEDLKMAEYLRPSTLFQPSKFPAYLQSATKWESAGRPVRENGQWVSTMVARSSYDNVDYSQIPEGFRG
ncbi:conserved phage C-terminal domain-containing protein [Cronobacter sakazakii]|nr:conserved phage C-terminal domain-containing protein [Cronobacter sakazakii]